MKFLHFLCKVILKALLHIFWIFPVKPNRITLLNELSYTYGDSLKYINKYLQKNRKGQYEIVYPLKKIKDCAKDIICVKPMTLRYFYYLLTSKCVITNAGGISYLPIRKKQLVISTWHGGGPYKKTSTDVYKDFWYILESKMNVKNTDYMLSSCSYFTEYEAKAMYFTGRKCIASGLPRNDIFFESDDEIRKKVCTFYNIPNNKKIVMYAPTYRVDVNNYTNSKKINNIEIDYKRVIENLRKKFGFEWVFAVRLHPKLKDAKWGNEGVINFTDYPDMQELLYASDVIITDYSSLMWDFSLSFKPCFLFADDIEEYEQKRGFYMPVSKWPYPLAHNNDEMERNIIQFNMEDYKEKVKQHHIESGSYEKGKACEIVVDLIERKNI